jgi:hypothetical protein
MRQLTTTPTAVIVVARPRPTVGRVFADRG